MNKDLLKEKRIYFLFSKMKNQEQSKTHLTLIVDTFINKKNSFLTAIEISKELKSIGISIDPDILLVIVGKEDFKHLFEFKKQDLAIDTPFFLKKNVYDNYNAYENYTNKLGSYIERYLKESKKKSCDKEQIIEILLHTIFNRNLSFLKQMLKSSDATKLEKLLVFERMEYSENCYEAYNDMILDSGDELNEIIKVLLYRVFDFFNLHYNPHIDTTITEKYKNKVFYLDSSFILRLFGFDNEIREQRSLELINILRNVEGVQFMVHNETISEAQHRIGELIDKVENILRHSFKGIKSIASLDGKGNDTIDLFLRMKLSGKISGREDFRLHYSSVMSKLQSIIGPKLVNRDDNKIRIRKEKQQLISSALEGTEKTSLRKKHISRLLLHIDELRGSNNYNIYDIKYWLLTTDNATLKIDANLRKVDETDNSKSVCILPTELLRTISNRGEIAEDYVTVFKKFMIYSNVFREEYSDRELESIETLLTLAENANQPEYDVDFYIDKLFNEISLKEILNRIDKIDEKTRRDKELIKIFNETFDGKYREKYLLIIRRTKAFAKVLFNILFFSIIFFLPILILVKGLLLVVNPDIDIKNPLTYVNEENWSKLELVFVFLEIVLIPGTIWVYIKFRRRFQNWLLDQFLSTA